MNLTDSLSGPVADALGWTLLHALWQGFALVLPTAVVLHLLRNGSSNRRYQVGVLTLLTQLLTSAATADGQISWRTVLATSWPNDTRESRANFA